MAAFMTLPDDDDGIPSFAEAATVGNGSEQAPIVLDSAFLDETAARMVPEDLGVVGVDLEAGTLLVAWPEPPDRAELDRVAGVLGVPIVAAVAPGGLFERLESKARRARGDRPQHMIERLLDEMLAIEGSDLHMWAGAEPRARVGGTFAALPNTGVLEAEDLEGIAQYIAPGVVTDENWKGDHDCAFAYSGWRFRVSLFRQQGTVSATLRAIPTHVPRFIDLGLPETVAHFAELSQGLLLFAGPTGAGKSTSLAAFIDVINHNRAVNIITIEDPIEYVHTPERSIIRQREVGLDTASFPIALRAALRQDPDVILVGELRDLETISTAITAAETGHLVVTTVHATDSEEAINRLVDVFPPTQQQQIRVQLADVLAGVVAQSLFPAINAPTKRRLVCEIMVATNAIKNLIRGGHPEQIPTYIQSGVDKDNMQPFDLGLARAVVTNLVDPEDAKGRARNERTYRAYLASLRPNF
ncbi:MAG: type IV pilus twitching motility protein PilT [Acidimicrobiales bacterium]